MNQTASQFVLWLSIFTLNCLYGSPDQELTLDSPKISPDIVSASGKRRIKDYLQTVEQNISLTELNLNSVQKNLNIIQAEIQELDRLKTEHETLKTRYKEFFEGAKREMQKNQKAMLEIEEFERKVQKLESAKLTEAQIAEIEAAKAERKEREKWKSESEEKVARVNQLIAGVEKNLRSIQTKRDNLSEQIQTWTAKQTEYNGMLTKLQKKRQDAERFLASKSN